MADAMDDNVISQLLGTPAEGDYGESDIIKMRKVVHTTSSCSHITQITLNISLFHHTI